MYVMYGTISTLIYYIPKKCIPNIIDINKEMYILIIRTMILKYNNIKNYYI